MAANTNKNVVEEVVSIAARFKNPQPLWGAFGIKQRLCGFISRFVIKPGDGGPEVMDQVIVLTHDQPIHEPTWINPGVFPAIT